MERKLIVFLATIFFFSSCSRDVIYVQQVLRGNSVLLSNNVVVELVGVVDSEANQKWMNDRLLNEEVLVLDENNGVLELSEKEGRFNGFLMTLDGVNINDQLRIKKQLSVKTVPPSEKVFTLQELYKINKDAVFLIYTSDGRKYKQGSGFFISKDGIGISNYHVFAGTFKGNEVIKLLNGQEYKIEEVLTSSKESDYIVFKVAGSQGELFPFTRLANQPPAVGEVVFAIGNPKGLESTLSTGIVSSIRETEQLIQTTAEITNGSSGGPLFNMKGEVIGITSSGMGEANLNFAIDIRVLNLK